MYQIQGADFASLFCRTFSENFKSFELSGSLPGRFACYSSGYQGEGFEVLHFRGCFEENVQVKSVQDHTHISLHFQLNGYSDARISGFDQILPMAKGELNLLNCVNPEGSFYFPSQQQYEYVSISLSADYFQNFLLACGPAYESLLVKSVKGESFQTFSQNPLLGLELRSQLHLLMHPVVSDDLRKPYLEAKIKELLLLTLGGSYTESPTSEPVEKELFIAVRNYLQVNYLRPLTLKGIAQAFGTNDFKLKKGFKSTFGTTVFGYIHQLRMQYAYRLLISGEYSIGEIATLIGYGSDAAFIRAFHQQFGLSPGRLMK
ncbi:helix-turn-helix transcriptional regulator [Telluribacter sp. SYSU D00476]|uniref:helix-turn-helix transcriptional regulator n=1 Tax=Telluribacter sp. SYSU D00476 TaxID=2811430 RepID=UPI001FF67719|nr:AraC family transcriptional regulator [Telluribacter sp. SYSU D00476]